VLALSAAVLLAVTQAVALAPAERILPAAVPYALALVVLVAVRSRSATTEAARNGSTAATGDEPTGSGGVALLGERWVRALAAVGTALALWLLVRFVRALPGAVGTEFGFYRLKVQVTSPLGDHNTAAGLLLVAVVAATVLAGRDRRWYLATGLITFGLVATLSRAAALLLVALAAVAWSLASERRTALATSVVALVVVGGVFTAASVLGASPPPPSTGVGGPLADAGVGPLGVSVLGRVDLAVRGVELGRAHPWLGVGMGGFADHASDLPAPNDHAHQALAHAFAEGGVALLIVALALPIVLAVRVARLPRSRLRDVLLLGGLGLVAHAQVEILGGRLGYEVVLAVLLGLAGVAGDQARRVACERGAAGGP
jgi:hypothetical protein